MDKQDWGMDFVYNGPLANRVSCHSGDLGQRVSCNLIGDQPLFYIDDSADCVAEDFLFDQGVDSLADEDIIASLREKIESYDRSARSLGAGMEIESTATVFDRLLSADQGVAAIIAKDDLIAYGCQSGTFTAYYNFLRGAGIAFDMSESVGSAVYDRNSRTVFINPFMSVERAIAAMSESMRCAWHHTQGTLINPLHFQPEDAVLVNRLIDADLKIISVEIAWELRLAGKTALWNMMMAGADYDLCSAYAMEAMTNFRSIKNGLASRATFEKWFLSGRCKLLDRAIIQIMLGNKVDMIFDDEDTSRTIATDLVAKIGVRPLGKNYLAPIVTQIMVDSIYGDVRDRSNANFLWFITFERKMSETEQELQQSGRLIQTASAKAKDISHDATTDIIAFPARPSIGQSGGADENGEASLFYLDHFRAL